MVNAAQLQAAVQEALLAQQEAQQAEIAVRIQNAVQAALAAQQPPPPAPEGYTSPYNTPLPNLTHAPFSDTDEGAPRIPEADLWKQLPKVTPLRLGMDKGEVESVVYTNAMDSMRLAAKRARRYFMSSLLLELDVERKAIVTGWLSEHSEVLSTAMPLPEEAEWLRRFTDVCIGAICEVLSPADSLQQLRDLRQKSDQCMEGYINVFFRLCASAERVITADRAFTPSELTTVAENLSFFCAGIRNNVVKELAMSARLQFSGHPTPTAAEFKRQLCMVVQTARAQLQLPGTKKQRSALLGLKFRETDTCLQEAQDNSPHLAIAQQYPAEQFAAIQHSTGITYLCGRCGRDDHLLSQCKETKTVRGKIIHGTLDDYFQNLYQHRLDNGCPRLARGRGRGGKSGRGKGRGNQSQPPAPQAPGPNASRGRGKPNASAQIAAVNEHAAPSGSAAASNLSGGEHQDFL